MGKPIILSLGSVNADFQVSVDKQIEGGLTVPAKDFTRLSGGKATNIAFIARRLGIDSVLLGRVGDDELKEQALKPLKELGVDLSHVSEAKGVSTAVSFICVPKDGQKSIILSGNANEKWDERSIADALKVIQDAPDGSVLVTDFEIPVDVVRKCVDCASKRGFTIVVDPSFADRADEHTLKKASVITPDSDEAEKLTGIKVEDDDESAAKAADALSKKYGISMVFVKMKDGGCVLAHEGKLTVFPPVKVDVVDKTGAGDGFCGALAVKLLEKSDLHEAGRFAIAYSSKAVTAWGSQAGYGTREEVQKMVDKQGDVTRNVEL